MADANVIKETINSEEFHGPASSSTIQDYNNVEDSNTFQANADSKETPVTSDCKKPYNCTNCNKSFTNKYYVNKHRLFVCPDRKIVHQAVGQIGEQKNNSEHQTASGSLKIREENVTKKVLDVKRYSDEIVNPMLEIMEFKIEEEHLDQEPTIVPYGDDQLDYSEDTAVNKVAVKTTDVRNDKDVSKAVPFLYKCVFCHISFYYKHLYMKHILSKHKEKPKDDPLITESLIQCKLCPWKCKSYTALHEHWKSHAVEHTFKCDICNLDCINYYQMNRHMSTYHSGALRKRFECYMCTNWYPSQVLLRKHVKCHENVL